MGASKNTFQNMREEEQSLDSEHYKKATDNPNATGLSITTAKFLDMSKEGIKDMAIAITDEYKDGFKSPAELLLLSKKLEEFALQIKENIKSEAANELKLGKGEKGNVHGAIVTEQMTGVRYDFSFCGDKLYDDAMAIVKEREAFLKTVKGQQMTGDLSTGETWMVTEPVKSGSMSLIFKY